MDQIQSIGKEKSSNIGKIWLKLDQVIKKAIKVADKVHFAIIAISTTIVY